MCDVVSEDASLVAKHWILDLLVILLIQRILDILAYLLLETLDYSSIPPFKIIIQVPGTYLRCCGSHYDVWMHDCRLNWRGVIEGGFC